MKSKFFHSLFLGMFRINLKEGRREIIEDDGELLATCEAVQHELARVDQDVAERYFAGAASPASVVS